MSVNKLFLGSQRLVPFMRPQVRTMFGRGSLVDPYRSIIRDVEKSFNDIYHDMWRSVNNNLPRALPHVSSASSDNSNLYQLNIDMGGFKPEDIKISLKDRMLNIHAKMERKSDDGSRFYQEISREYLLPETLKVDELKSVFNDDGILRIEAPLPESEKPREIPIDRSDVPKKQLDSKQ